MAKITEIKESNLNKQRRSKYHKAGDDKSELDTTIDRKLKPLGNIYRKNPVFVYGLIAFGVILIITSVFFL